MVPGNVYWLCEIVDSLMGAISGQRGGAQPAGKEGAKLTPDERTKQATTL